MVFAKQNGAGLGKHLLQWPVRVTDYLSLKLVSWKLTQHRSQRATGNNPRPGFNCYRTTLSPSPLDDTDPGVDTHLNDLKFQLASPGWMQSFTTLETFGSPLQSSSTQSQQAVFMETRIELAPREPRQGSVIPGDFNGWYSMHPTPGRLLPMVRQVFSWWPLYDRRMRLGFPIAHLLVLS